MGISFKKTSRLSQISRALLAGGTFAVDETSHVIKAKAKQNAPEDKGPLKASIHVVNSDKSEYRDAVDKAIAMNPEVADFIADEMKVDQAERGVIQNIVDAPMGYSEAVEKGYSRTDGTYQKPQPFMEPAGDSEKANYEKRLRDELKHAAK